MSRMIALWFGAGAAPKAPGTFGSAAAIPVWFVIYILGGWVLVLLSILVVSALGTWAIARETEGQEDHDPSEIVVDEVAGQWIALFPLSAGIGPSGLLGVLLAFALFRAFDITKPGPIGWADQMQTPFGVMLDDILAGIASAIVLIMLGFFIS